MASIADKSRTKEIIDRLQTLVNTASPTPLSPGKISLYKDELQNLLNELALQIESELKTYHEVNDRRGKIISEAKKEAEKIIYEAEHSASRMRVSKRATGVAPLDYDLLDDEEKSALGNANEIYAASLIYTDEMLTEVNTLIEDAYHNIRSDYEIILQVLEDKMNTISSNRAELMDGLQEMDTDERSQQILEIGQLLSNELYTSRMKAKMNPDEYEDGSIQLRLDLQEEAEEKAREAEEKAQRATEALAQMTAERDALKATVQKLRDDGMSATIKSVKTSPATTKSFVKMEEEATVTDDKAKDVVNSQSTSEIDEEEEYEVIYVTEDELEEGEEYEIEYVDDIEEEDLAEENKTVEMDVQTTSDTKKEENESEAVTLVENKEIKKEMEEEEIPIIPHFKTSTVVATVPSEQIAGMAKAISTEKKYSGLISRAVKQKEEEQAAKDTVIMVTEHFPRREEKKPVEKDKDIRTDADGTEYVQATLQFDDDYDVTEF